MLCTRCKKRMAVVFVTRIEGDKNINEGLCMQCAAELGITPAVNAAEKLGLTPSEMDEMTNELMQAMNEEGGEDGFEPGGTAAFPFLQKMFGAQDQQQDQQTQREGAAPKPDEKNAKKKKPPRKALGAYCQNLVQKAKEGKLDRIVGRDREIARVVQILNRRTKNNPCLIGEPGVGKTAVAEGLAIRIAEGAVPAKLQDKEVMLLDLTALVAGTQFRGQFESRIKTLLEEIKQNGNIILFIDEVHNLMAAGDAEGSMNAANLLKPALSRGEVQVVGATTFNEYRKHIEKDSALERRFQPVVVEEPTIEDTVEILKGVKGYYESFHGVRVDGETVRKAVELSERYITDRFLPDKAIDLLDEACSAASIKSVDYNRRFEVERRLGEIKEQIEEFALDGSEEKYAELALMKSDECQLENELAELEKKPAISIGVDSLAKVIELWTGIPAAKIKEDELVKLQTLGAQLKTRIIGQDEAVDAVCRALKKNRVGISPKRKPVSFIFTGPTGVGKTELVKRLSAELFDSVETLVRLDMSEFMEKHSVSRLIGSPPGYVGYDEAGQLTEKIRRRPYSVVLFDEIEKAHPDVLNILLQILDDGRVTDAHGRTVNFENTVIIMTSNAGSENKSQIAGFNKTVEQQNKEKAIKALSEFLRPEFINRVDEVVVFNPLAKQDIEKIAHIQLDDLKKAIGERGREFVYDDEVCALLAEKAYSPKFGARELRRVIEREIESPIAELIIERGGEIADVRASVKSGVLSIN